MKLFEAIKKASGILNNSTSPQLDSEVILSSLLKVDRIYLYINRDIPLAPDIETEFFKRIKRRYEGEPVQYITGVQEFMSLEFNVRYGVLIPRPDTEVLVETVLDKIKTVKNPVIIDVGCGSGAISVSIANYKKDAFLYALDIMDIPLVTTLLNAKKHMVEDRIKIIKSDMLESMDNSSFHNIDVIVSNPPYIKENEIKRLQREVKDYEPDAALNGGEDGLKYYRILAHDSLKFLKCGGIIALEIGYNQKNDVSNLLKTNGYININCKCDLSGLDRVITAQKP